MSTIVYKENALERFYVYGSGNTLGAGAGASDRRIRKTKTGSNSENEFSTLLARQMAVTSRG